MQRVGTASTMSILPLLVVFLRLLSSPVFILYPTHPFSALKNVPSVSSIQGTEKSFVWAADSVECCVSSNLNVLIGEVFKSSIVHTSAR